jgi:ABC-type nitrate/sulfonate/bicarbonate transport system substrate-binding protein
VGLSSRVVLVLLLTTGMHPVSAKVNYVDSPALSKTSPATVAACGSAGTVQVPIITWGADMATILANGNSATTMDGSIFARQGLRLRLVREDVFANQVNSFLTCKSPYLRGTLGMMHIAADVTDSDPRTRLVVIHQLSWSAGGDALVVKSGINRPADLRGKTIALQAYGPHIDYLAKVLRDGGLGLKDVKIRWTRDLTGTDQSPRSAFYDAEVQAALVIIPDALALTSQGKVGTGAEDSVKGARILLSTKTANRIITDVYAVRADYFKANRDTVQNFVKGLMLAQEQLQASMKKPGSAEQKAVVAAAAQLLLDSPQATADTEAMYRDAALAGYAGNVNFFTSAQEPRNFDRLNNEIASTLAPLGLTAGKAALAQAKWDYNAFKPGLANTQGVILPAFDTGAVTQVISGRAAKDQLSEGELFKFQVQFRPNQNSFDAKDYGQDFERAIDLASTYGGAIISVEGHADPLGYLKKKDAGEDELILGRIRQSGKNLSYTRATAVRDSLIAYAKAKNVRLDPSQFALVGHGIEKPRTGLCGAIPCRPKTEQDWLSNMRVEFRIIQVEAEENVFSPR